MSSFERKVERFLNSARIFVGMNEQHRRIFLKKVLDEAANGVIFGRLLFNINLLTNHTRREPLYLGLAAAITRYYVVLRDNFTTNADVAIRDRVLKRMLTDLDKVTQEKLNDQENGKDDDDVDR